MPNDELKPATEQLPSEAAVAGAAPCSANPMILCSHCGKQITGGNVLVIGDDIMGSPFFCSMQCMNDYKPDTLTRAKLESIFGRWRKTTSPNDKLTDSRD